MNLSKAIQTLAEEAHRTGKPTAGIVRARFRSLVLSPDDIEALAAEALSSRVNTLLTSGTFTATHPPTSVSIPISVRYSASPAAIRDGKPESTVEPPPPIKISVDVIILHQTLLEVNGTRKPIIDFGLSDLRYILKKYGAEINGYTAKSEVFRYTVGRLETLGKTKVSQLAQGEQTIIARKWKATTKLADNAAVA